MTSLTHSLTFTTPKECFRAIKIFERAGYKHWEWNMDEGRTTYLVVSNTPLVKRESGKKFKP